MPVFAYQGLNDTGAKVRGILEADSAKGARLALRGQGIFPTDVQEEAAAGKRQRHPRRLGRAVCDTPPRGRDDAFCLTTAAAEVHPGPTLISL